MADKESNAVEVLSVSEEESKGKPSVKQGSVKKTKNTGVKTGKPKPKSSVPNKKNGGVNIVESPKKKSVIVIDLTDDSEELNQASADKKVTKVPPHHVLLPSIKLIDLKEKAIESIVGCSECAVAAFVGNREEEKKGILELTPKNEEDLKKALTSLKKITVSEKRELSATKKPPADSGVNQSLLAELQNDLSGNDNELTSVFINNIPSEARLGILKIMFPTAVNIQFPQDADGNSLGYAVLEVAGRHSAEAIIKHHKLYIPKIGTKVLKLHIVGGTSTSEPEIILSDDESKESNKKKVEDKAKADISAKTTKDHGRKAIPNKPTLAKPEKSKALNKSIDSAVKSERDKDYKSKERKPDGNRSRSRSRNQSSGSSQRRNHSPTRDRRSPRDRGRRSRSAERRDRWGDRPQVKRLNTSGDRARIPSRDEARKRSRSPDLAARQSRWEPSTNNQRIDHNARPQRTSFSNDRGNNKGSSLTGLNGPHELMFPGNVGPTSMAGLRGGMPGQINLGQRGQTLTGIENRTPGSTVGQQRNQVGRYHGIGSESSHQRTPIEQRNVMSERRNPTSQQLAPLVGPGSQMIQPTPALLRQGNPMAPKVTQQLGQLNAMTAQGNNRIGQNPMIGQGIMMGNQGIGQGQAIPMMGQVGMNRIYGQGTPAQQQQQSQLIGQDMQFNQMTGQRNSNIGQPILTPGNQMMGQNNQMMAQNNQMMGQGTSNMGQQNSAMGLGIQSLGQMNQMMGQGNQSLVQSNLMMGQRNSMAAQGSQMQGIQMARRGSQIMGQDSQMRQGLDSSQVMQSRLLTAAGNYGAATQKGLGATPGNLPVTSITPSLGRNAGVSDTRQSQRNSFTSVDMGQSESNRGSMRRDDKKVSDSRSRFSDRAEMKATGRSSRFDRSRSPVQSRGSRSQTVYDDDTFSSRPSRFDDRVTGSRDRTPHVHKSVDDKRRQYGREQPQPDQRGDSNVKTSPDLSNIRSQLMNTLRQLETGNLSDTTELADIAEKIKQVQQQQQNISNPMDMSGSRRSGDLQRMEPRSSSKDGYNPSRGGSFEPRQDYTDRHTTRDSSGFGQSQPSWDDIDRRRSPSRLDRYDRESSGNRMEDKVTIDYGHQTGPRSTFREEQDQRFSDTRIEKDYPRGGQSGHSVNYGSQTNEPSRYGGRDTNPRDTMSDSSRDLKREDLQSRGQSQQFGGINQREAMLDSSLDMHRQGYGTETFDRSSFNNFSSSNFGSGQMVGGQGVMQQSGENRSAFKNPLPWQKSSTNPPPLMSVDKKPVAQLAQSQERTKKVYVGNLPPSAKWDEVAKFFNIEMWKRRLTSPVSINKPVAGVVQAPDRSYAYVMFNTADEAEGAVLLDGIRYENNILNIKTNVFGR